jgi:hypothetical protein
VPVIMVHELVGRVAAMDGCLSYRRPPAAMVEPVHGTANLVVASRHYPRCLGALCVWAKAATIGRVKKAGGFVDEGVGMEKRSNAVARGESDEEAFMDQGTQFRRGRQVPVLPCGLDHPRFLFASSGQRQDPLT